MLKTHRGALMALGAATLLAALVFLFVKTAGTEFRHDAQSLNLLREMRDLDNHWDDDSARMANDFSNTGTQADFPAMVMTSPAFASVMTCTGDTTLIPLENAHSPMAVGIGHSTTPWG